MRTATGGWRGTGHEAHLTLLPEENAQVEAAHRDAAALRPRLDRELRRIEADTSAYGAELQGLDYSLKGLDSYQSKIARAVYEDPDGARMNVVTDKVAKTRDLNRYTLTFPTERYAAGVGASYQQLRDSGFEPLGAYHKNTWEQPDYKGLNTSWRHQETGQVVEIQFHTPESFAIKQQNHLIYELDRAGSLTPEERDAAAHLQAERYRNVPIPEGYERFGIRQDVRRMPETTPEIMQRVRDKEATLAAEKQAEKEAAEARQGPGTVHAEGRNPTGPAPPDSFPRSAPSSNQDMSDSDGGLPGTHQPVRQAADARGTDLTGTDLTGTEVHIIYGADETRFAEADQPGHGADGYGVHQDADERELPGQQTTSQDGSEHAADQRDTYVQQPDQRGTEERGRDESDSAVGAGQDPDANQGAGPGTAGRDGNDRQSPAGDQRPEPVGADPQCRGDQREGDQRQRNQVEHDQAQHSQAQHGQHDQAQRDEREPDQIGQPGSESDRTGRTEPEPEPDQIRERDEPVEPQRAPEQQAPEQQTPAQESDTATNYDQQAASDDARVADSMESDSGDHDSGSYESEGASQDTVDYARDER